MHYCGYGRPEKSGGDLYSLITSLTPPLAWASTSVSLIHSMHSGSYMYIICVIHAIASWPNTGKLTMESDDRFQLGAANLSTRYGV